VKQHQHDRRLLLVLVIAAREAGLALSLDLLDPFLQGVKLGGQRAPALGITVTGLRVKCASAASNPPEATAAPT
jgi:hypothetical protein